MDGWIKLHRQIFENPLSNKPNYLSVWIYLLSYANHCDKEIIWNNKKITIKRGSFIGSLRKIGEHFNISVSTVKYIINYLISEQMIEHSSNGKYSVFTIKNYHHYQEVEHKVEQLQNSDETVAKTTKNDKKEKKRERELKNIQFEKEITDSYLEEIAKQFPQLSGTLTYEREKAHDWLLETGSIKKNYRAFFRNWIRKSVEYRK